MEINEVLKLIPVQPQRQDAMLDQLNDLHRVAIKLGMYDAADILRDFMILDSYKIMVVNNEM